MTASSHSAARTGQLRRLALRCGAVLGIAGGAWLMGSLWSTASADINPPPPLLGGLLDPTNASVQDLVGDLVAPITAPGLPPTADPPPSPADATPPSGDPKPPDADPEPVAPAAGSSSGALASPHSSDSTGSSGSAVLSNPAAAAPSQQPTRAHQSATSGPPGTTLESATSPVSQPVKNTGNSRERHTASATTISAAVSQKTSSNRPVSSVTNLEAQTVSTDGGTAAASLGDAVAPPAKAASRTPTGLTTGLESVLGDASSALEPVVDRLALVTRTAVPMVGDVAGSAAPVVESGAEAAAPVVQPIAIATTPLVEALAPVVDGLAGPVLDATGQLTAPILAAVAPATQAVGPVTEPVHDAISPVVTAVRPVTQPVVDAVSPMLQTLEPVTGDVDGVLDPVTPTLPVPLGPDGPADLGDSSAPVESVGDGPDDPAQPAVDPPAPSSSQTGPDALPLAPAGTERGSTGAESVSAPAGGRPGHGEFATPSLGATAAPAPSAHRPAAVMAGGAPDAPLMLPAGQPAPVSPIAPNDEAPAAAPASGSGATSGSGGLQIAAVMAGFRAPDNQLFAVPARAEAATLPQHIEDPGFSPD